MFSFKYFLPEINFQNLNSSLAIKLFSFPSLYFLSPINVIFLILALEPRSILKTISTFLSPSSIKSIFMFEK